jgi:hypothetical protein
LHLLKNLLYKVERFPARKAILYKEALVLIHDMDKEVVNPGDRNVLNRQLSDINELRILEKELPLLQVFD